MLDDFLWFEAQVGGDSSSDSEAEDSDSGQEEADREEVYGVTSAISLTHHKVKAQD